jgi:hypothetical protein
MQTMSSSNSPKDCFGDQGGTILHGEPPEKCLNCNIFDKCHKITIASTLQAIGVDLSLLIQNGLASGWLKAFKELDDKEAE